MVAEDISAGGSLRVVGGAVIGDTVSIAERVAVGPKGVRVIAVSYTHLTLPTIYSV